MMFFVLLVWCGAMELYWWLVCLPEKKKCSAYLISIHIHERWMSAFQDFPLINVVVPEGLHPEKKESSNRIDCIIMTSLLFKLMMNIWFSIKLHYYYCSLSKTFIQDSSTLTISAKQYRKMLRKICHTLMTLWRMMCPMNVSNGLKNLNNNNNTLYLSLWLRECQSLSPCCDIFLSLKSALCLYACLCLDITKLTRK